MNPLLTVFIIGVLGYLLGSIKVKGLSLGTSSVLIVALLFGHYGMEIPSVIREFGLICFVTAVGFIALRRRLHAGSAGRSCCFQRTAASAG